MGEKLQMAEMHKHVISSFIEPRRGETGAVRVGSPTAARKA